MSLRHMRALRPDFSDLAGWQAMQRNRVDDGDPFANQRLAASCEPLRDLARTDRQGTIPLQRIAAR
jgi:hypothetical protein